MITLWLAYSFSSCVFSSSSYVDSCSCSSSSSYVSLCSCSLDIGDGTCCGCDRWMAGELTVLLIDSGDGADSV